MQSYQHTITCSLAFLQETIDRRLQLFFQKDTAAPFAYPEIVLEDINAPINRFLVHYQVNIEEYIVLLLALTPHIQPNFFDAIIQTYLPNGGDFAEIGGVKGNNHRGTIPTGETALFILGGNDITKRMQVAHYFSPDHFFAKEHILSLEQLRDGEPRMSGKIILQPDYIDLFTIGTISKPVFGPDFPAKSISTKLNWNDLVLNTKTETQIQDIKLWLDHNQALMNDWEMANKVKPGYRALFYGPSGTGKTLTATLLGKQFQKEVYRIDLSQIVSKYIGETEKNLEKVFDKAEHKDWILFFDEADALFGKRTNVQNAHDKYANQEVSYLLQRVEDFPGLIILASNYKSNIDQAFVRRFNAIVHFPMPNTNERYEIWKTSIPPKAKLADDIDLKMLSNKYELTGSSIISVVHYASLQTIHKNSSVIQKKDLIEGIKREYEKEEKVFVS
ncbi:ATP-binding protein [Solitalea canadensis]|uniref:AAA+ family ATPase n=1 Tax=Solitalea canadensis (strain ATCC 29591 / DSM 3403 / JCM 21819 / LMG 8368 / NBRC 15130 / NCIMB 12057 / USAM 9D) TaxID=929556 RepID=H8KU81_SOLCM|nr:ATP-binding protein [Solitalea canadensis]AFD07193.1 AAA+ family ATPase [Solitalea canadensis DSM 3403]